MAGPNRPYPKRQPPVRLNCAQCGGAFTRPAWRVAQAARAGSTLSCSYDCAHALRRVHTPESKVEWHREYRERNRDWINEKQSAARFGPRREHILEQGRKSYRDHISANRKRAREYISRHYDETIARRVEWGKRNPDRVHWHSARSNLAAQMGVKPRMVPDCLVDAKVAFLSVRRTILTAQGMEARQGGGEDAVHDSPVGNADAPNPSPED